MDELIERLKAAVALLSDPENDSRLTSVEWSERVRAYVQQAVAVSAHPDPLIEADAWLYAAAVALLRSATIQQQAA